MAVNEPYLPFIPEYITVHLGAPQSAAQNVTVFFPDYIKNVASSEIFPTWNVSAIRANVLAQISYALNRIYLEYYRSRGYDFDITNSTGIDQSFVNGRNIYENIDEIVNEIFNTYIRRIGNIEPLAAKYCDGTTTTCDGLSQWGSQQLAEQGLNSVEILRRYYGDDIELVGNAPVRGGVESYPGTPVSEGATGNDVWFIQTTLNRISQNYPRIPKIYSVDGVFGETTLEAVRVFQEIFNLTVDGVVGRETWYKLVFLYVGVKNLSELDSEGQRLFGLSLEYPDAISEGDSGEKVYILQFFISVLADFYLTIPPVGISGTFGPETKNSVIQFQKQFGLPQTGIVDDDTWNFMYDAFKGIVDVAFADDEIFAINTLPYPGTPLRNGSSGADVRALQDYLNVIALTLDEINPVTPDGIFGPQTEAAVREFQEAFNLPQTGIVDRDVWNEIATRYKNVVSARTSRPLQYPGRVLKLNDTDAYQNIADPQTGDVKVRVNNHPTNFNTDSAVSIETGTRG